MPMRRNGMSATPQNTGRRSAARRGQAPDPLSRKGARSVLLLALALVACLASGCAALRFRAVHEGVLYVSAQPTVEALADLHGRHGFRTILNLRGAQPDEAWYQREKTFAETHGIRYVNVDLRRRTAPTQDDLAVMTAVFDDAAGYPVLAHCWGGSERAGVTAAVYRIRNQGWSNRDALDEMTALGFSPDFFPILADFVESYAPDR